MLPKPLLNAPLPNAGGRPPKTSSGATPSEITNTSRPIIIGVAILVFALVAFFTWACFAPLDEGVPAAGTITVESKRKLVQHLSGGIIKQILVKEAQEVKAGEPLIILDDTIAKANFDATRQQYYALQAQADRLYAEVTKAPKITFSAGLLNATNDPVAANNMATQRQLIVSRREAYQGELAILGTAEQGLQEQIIGLEAQARGKKEQLRLVNEQLEGSRQLAKEGYLPRNRWFEDERLAADLLATSTDIQASILRVKNSVLEARARLAQRPRDYQKEVETQYSDSRRDAMIAAEKLRAAKEDLDRTIIRAPAKGFVNGMSPLTEGSVITPGVRLMDIVPKDEALILEVKIDPNVIDRVHTGLHVAINLHAFANDPTLVLDGVLDSVSVDLVSDNAANASNVPPHYLGRVRVTPEGMKKLGSRNLQPGMPAQVTIKTGERSMIKYLLKPFMLRLSSTMKES